MAQGDWIVPIPGTTKLHRLQENLAADQVTFTAGEMRRLNGELDQIVVTGDRYNAQQNSLTEQ